MKFGLTFKEEDEEAETRKPKKMTDLGERQ
jgi:hypothetical protein